MKPHGRKWRTTRGLNVIRCNDFFSVARMGYRKRMKA